MLKSKSDDDTKKIKLKFLFGDSARPNDGDIKPDDQEGEEGDDSIKFYYTITKDDVNGSIKYSITDIKDVDNRNIIKINKFLKKYIKGEALFIISQEEFRQT